VVVGWDLTALSEQLLNNCPGYKNESSVKNEKVQNITP